MYTIWNLDILLGSIGNKRLDIGYWIWDIGYWVLDIEDTVGDLVGHGFVAPMGAIEVHRVTEYHHFGGGDVIGRHSVAIGRRSAYRTLWRTIGYRRKAGELWVDIFVVATRGNPQLIILILAQTMRIEANSYLLHLSEVTQRNNG